MVLGWSVFETGNILALSVLVSDYDPVLRAMKVVWCDSVVIISCVRGTPIFRLDRGWFWVGVSIRPW